MNIPGPASDASPTVPVPPNRQLQSGTKAYRSATDPMYHCASRSRQYIGLRIAVVIVHGGLVQRVID